MTNVVVRAVVETRKAAVELEERVNVAPDRRIEGAVAAAVSRIMTQAFDQGFLREHGTDTVKIEITRL